MSKRLIEREINGAKLTQDAVTRLRSKKAVEALGGGFVPPNPNLVHRAAELSHSADFLRRAFLWFRELRYFSSASAIGQLLVAGEVNPFLSTRLLECKANSGIFVEKEQWEDSLLLAATEMKEGNAPRKDLIREYKFIMSLGAQKLSIECFLSFAELIPPFQGEEIHRLRICQAEFTNGLEGGVCKVPGAVLDKFKEVVHGRETPGRDVSNLLGGFAPYVEEVVDLDLAREMAMFLAAKGSCPSWQELSMIARLASPEVLQKVWLSHLDELNWTDPRVLRLSSSAENASILARIKSVGRQKISEGFPEVVRTRDVASLISYLGSVARADLDLAFDLLSPIKGTVLGNVNASSTLEWILGSRSLVDRDDAPRMNSIEGALVEDRSHSQLFSVYTRLSAAVYSSPLPAELLRLELGSGGRSSGSRKLLPESSFSLIRQWQGDYGRQPIPSLNPVQKQFAAVFPNFLRYGELNPDFSAESVLVVADQGVSDEVRALQMLPWLTERCDEVILTCDPRLAPLIARTWPSVITRPIERMMKGRPMADRRVLPGVSLPVRRHIDQQLLEDGRECSAVTLLDNLMFMRTAMLGRYPDSGSYLSPCLQSEVATQKSLRIGLQWRSHLSGSMRSSLYPTLNDLTPILELPGVSFVSLQHELREDEAALLADYGVWQTGADLFNDFEAIASVTSQLDFVVGSSSLPIELASAVGTHALHLGFSPETIWLRTNGELPGRGGIKRDFLSANSSVCLPWYFDSRHPIEESKKSAVDVAKNMIRNSARSRSL